MQKDKTLFHTHLIYFILILSFCLMRLVWATGALNFLGDYSSYVFTLIVQVGIMFLLPLFLFSFVRKQPARKTLTDFRFKKISGTSVLISIGLGVVVFILTMFIASFFDMILSIFGYHPATSSAGQELNGWLFLLEVLCVAVLPAFCEEFSHRGLLIKGQSSLGVKKAILFSAILFGLVHLNIGQFFYATMIGLVLATVTVLTGSIFPAMIIHFMNNFISRYLAFARALNWPFGNFYEVINSLTGESAVLGMIFVMILIVLLVSLLTKGIEKLFKMNAANSLKQFAYQINLLRLRDEVLEGVEEPKTAAEKMQQIPFELLGVPVGKTAKPTLMGNLFLYASLFLGGLVTIFTFIWGML